MSGLTKRATALRAALNTITDEDVERLNLDACDVIDMAEYLRSGSRGVPITVRVDQTPFRVSVPEQEELQDTRPRRFPPFE